MTFEDLKNSIAQELPQDGGFSIDFNVPLLSVSWKKSDADILISHVDSTHHNFAVLVATSKSATNKIDLRYAKMLVVRMVEEYGFWIGLIWNEGEIQLYNPAIEERKIQWKKITIEDIVESAKTFVNSKIPNDFTQSLIYKLREIKPLSKF